MSFAFEGTDRFQVIRKLGEGGMGIVYEALDRDCGEHVALKTLRVWSPDALLRLKKEFRDFQHFDHPNLVRLGELFEKDGAWFFTMELIDGLPWTAFVRPTVDGKVALDRARLNASLAQLIAGLSALHAEGKIHRDLKPSNVLVTPEGRVVLLDFGLASDATRSGDSSSGLVMGTPAYMAPEQVETSNVGAAADWYSVGVLLYQSIAGVLPFTGSVAKVTDEKRRIIPRPLCDLVSTIPVEIDQACQQLLVIDPSKRYRGVEMLRRIVGLPEHDSVSFRQDQQSSETDAPVFVGRDAELAQLKRSLDDVRSQQKSRVTCVWGESGIGKTALVEQFVRNIRVSFEDVVVFSARCYETESVPYKAIDGVVDGITRYLGKMSEDKIGLILPSRVGRLTSAFPVLSRIDSIAQRPIEPTLSDPAAMQAELFQAMRELLQRLAAHKCVVVIIDDFQWADGDSLSLLAEALREPNSPTIYLVATARSGARGAVDKMMSDPLPNVDVIELPPLQDNEVARMLKGLNQSFDEAESINVSRIIAEAKGHPLFVQELAHPTRMDGELAVGERPLLDNTLWDRICTLSPERRRLLEVLALASKPLTATVAFHAAGIERSVINRDSKLLKSLRFIRTADSGHIVKRIEIYHDRIRASISSHLTPDARKLHHNRLATTLELIDPNDAETLSYHWMQADDLPKALVYLELAADRSERAVALERAVGLYRQCVDLLEQQSMSSVHVRLKLARIIAATGRGEESARMYHRLAREPSLTADSVFYSCHALEQFLRSGYVKEGLHELDAMLDLVGVSAPKNSRATFASFLWGRVKLRLRGYAPDKRIKQNTSKIILDQMDVYWSAGIGLFMIDQVRAMDFHNKHLLLALESGDPMRITRGYVIESVLNAALGRVDENFESTLREGITKLSMGQSSRYFEALSLFVQSVVNFVQGKWSAVESTMWNVERLNSSEDLRLTWETAYMKQNYVCSLCYLGDLKTVAATVHEHMPQAKRTGDFYSTMALCSGFPNITWLVCNDPDRARKEANEAIGNWTYDGFFLQHLIDTIGQVHIDFYEGKWAPAYRRGMEGSQKVQASLLSKVQFNRVLIDELMGRCALGVATSDTGKRSSMLRIVGRSVRQLRREKMPWSGALADTLDAGAMYLSDNVRQAVSLLARAIAVFDQNSMRLHRTAAQMCWMRVDPASFPPERSSEAADYVREQGILCPYKLARIFVPWMPHDGHAANSDALA